MEVIIMMVIHAALLSAGYTVVYGTCGNISQLLPMFPLMLVCAW
jgi:hypothetical protein